MISTRMTLSQALYEVASEHPEREALVCGDVRATYGRLAARSRALACGLHSQGLRKGDKVIAILPPCAEFIYLFFALAELGAVIVPLNPQSRRRQLAHVLGEVEPKAVVTATQLMAGETGQAIADWQKDDPRQRRVILTGVQAGAALHLDDLMAIEPPASFVPPAVTPDDLLMLLYTSGTTGTPKGAMHSHRGLIAPEVASLKVREMWGRPSLATVGRAARVVARYGQRLLRVIGRPQTFLSTVGGHSITGIELVLQALLMGDRLVWMPRFNPIEMVELIQREKVTIPVAVPTAWTMVLGLKDLDRYDLSSVLICGTGTAPCPPELGQAIQKRFGCALHIGFGTTELAGGIAVSSLEDSADLQARTVGQPLPGMKVKIVDEMRRELPRGQVGELACQGEGVMLGYYAAPERTSQVVDAEGWYYTGDLATMDDRGYIRILGRKDDMIIRGGQNIYPAEIEACLERQERIQEAAVLGVPDSVGGERVWAFVILQEGAQMTVNEVLSGCRAELEAYKIPDEVRFVEDFPRSAQNKPQKYLLRQMVTETDQGTAQQRKESDPR